MAEARRIRVLVADDSAVVRRAIAEVLALDPRIEVVGEAADGVEAVEKARALRPDVITLDVYMPALDGLEAAARIMAEAPSRILIVTSAAQRELDIGLRALQAGALELISKPSGLDGRALRPWGQALAESIRIMAEVPVVRRRSRPSSASHAALPGPVRAADVVAIVASTGGPPALARILGALPGNLGVPLLIAQHMADGFAGGLVRWLAELTPLRVGIAEPGAPCQPGHVYFAPDRSDLEVDREHRLRVTPNAGRHCPSGDKLLVSLAFAYGERGAGIVLTGMGDDGSLGLLAVRRAGGVTLAQDEESCVVAGMPSAANRAGGVGTVVALKAMAGAIERLALAPGPPTGRV